MSSSDEIKPVSATQAAAVEGVSGSRAIEQVEQNRAIAEALASGAIDPVAAQQLIIDQVVAEQLPAGTPEQVERLRGELAALLAGDPALRSLLS